MADIRAIKKTIDDESLSGTDSEVLSKLYEKNILVTVSTPLTELQILGGYGSTLDESAGILSKLETIGESDNSVRYIICMLQRGEAVDVNHIRVMTKFQALVTSNDLTQGDVNKFKDMTKRLISLSERNSLNGMTVAQITKARAL